MHPSPSEGAAGARADVPPPPPPRRPVARTATGVVASGPAPRDPSSADGRLPAAAGPLDVSERRELVRLRRRARQLEAENAALRRVASHFAGSEALPK